MIILFKDFQVPCLCCGCSYMAGCLDWLSGSVESNRSVDVILGFIVCWPHLCSSNKTFSRWWFQTFFDFHPDPWGNDPI